MFHDFMSLAVDSAGRVGPRAKARVAQESPIIGTVGEISIRQADW